MLRPASRKCISPWVKCSAALWRSSWGSPSRQDSRVCPPQRFPDGAGLVRLGEPASRGSRAHLAFTRNEISAVTSGSVRRMHRPENVGQPVTGLDLNLNGVCCSPLAVILRSCRSRGIDLPQRPEAPIHDNYCVGG